jgi:hypothetical protein
MRRALLSIVTLVALVAACGPGGTQGPTTNPSPSATATEAPTAAPTTAPSEAPAASGPFGGAPYDITVPTGWQAFDLADPAAKAGLDAFVEANPSLAASIQQFESMTNARMAVNPLLGDFMLVITTPSGGISLADLAQSFTAQFQAVPGLDGTPKPENVTLPGGDAVHWDLKLSSNKPGGGTMSVEESLYLFASSSDAVVVEFVTPAGGLIPDEQSIVNSFRFRN